MPVPKATKEEFKLFEDYVNKRLNGLHDFVIDLQAKDTAQQEEIRELQVRIGPTDAIPVTTPTGQLETYGIRKEKRLREALKELRCFHRRYVDLSEFAQVFLGIKRARQELPKEWWK